MDLKKQEYVLLMLMCSRTGCLNQLKQQIGLDKYSWIPATIHNRHEPETQPPTSTLPETITVNTSVNQEVPGTSGFVKNVIVSRAQSIVSTSKDISIHSESLSCSPTLQDTPMASTSNFNV